MANELATKQQQTQTIRTLLEKSKAQLAMALPKHLSVDRLIRVAMTSIQRTPDLLKCDPVTLIGAVMQSAQLGLEPDGILGHAYLIPFKNTKKGIYEVQFMPGYKGLIDLARRSGQVVSIGAHVVYENEDFNLAFGTDEILKHTPLPPSTRGNKKGVYAVAKLKDGSVHFEYLWAEEVEAIKKTSKAKDFGPWVTNEEEMWRKTAIRRLAKYLPLSVEFAKASAVDELADAGLSTQELFDSDLPTINVEVAKKTTIDEAFNEMQEEPPKAIEPPKPETAIEVPKTAEKQPTAEAKSAKEAILNYGIAPGKMTAYIVRAIGSNKPYEELSEKEAEEVLQEIKKIKK